MGLEIAIGRWSHRWSLCAAVCLALASVLAFGAPAAVARSSLQARAHITEWPLPELGSNPNQIVAGNGGESAWFTNNVQRGNVNVGTAFHDAQVDRIDGSGEITPFSVGGVSISDVARGPGGISFVGDGYVGRIGPWRTGSEIPRPDRQRGLAVDRFRGGGIPLAYQAH